MCIGDLNIRWPRGYALECILAFLVSSTLYYTDTGLAVSCTWDVKVAY